MIEDKIIIAMNESFDEGKDIPGKDKYMFMWFFLAGRLKAILKTKYCLRCGKSTDAVIYCDNCLNEINTCEECGKPISAIGLCPDCDYKREQSRKDFTDIPGDESILNEFKNIPTDLRSREEQIKNIGWKDDYDLWNLNEHSNCEIHPKSFISHLDGR
jgi:hypothetical protein